MARKKHLIVIHGRATKPAGSEKKRLVLRALLHGLDRVSTPAANKLRNNRVKFDFIYYGDVNNELILKSDLTMKRYLTGQNDVRYGGGPCEAKGSYNQDLANMLAQKSFSLTAYKKFLKQHRDFRFLDELASSVSWVSSMVGLSDNIVRLATPDMGAYLMTRKVGSEVRQRLQGPLKRALLAGDDVCIVSHSMGCIVTYDVLWKFSQMSEYRDVQDAGTRVNLWLTLGNPLGEPGVRRNLYDASEGEDGKYPKHIIGDWVNIPARDDFVSHDSTVADDFRQMKALRYLRTLRDLPYIHNFWFGTSGTNPHKFYGYLDNPTVARRIAGWIQA